MGERAERGERERREGRERGEKKLVDKKQAGLFVKDRIKTSIKKIFFRAFGAFFFVRGFAIKLQRFSCVVDRCAIKLARLTMNLV